MIPLFCKHLFKISPKNSNQRGMTLVEIMVALALSGILALIIFQFMGDQSQKFKEQRMTSEMQQELRWAMQYITDYLQLAGNGVPTSGKWPTIECFDGGDGGSDEVTVLGCYRDIFVETTQNMSSAASQVEITDNNDIEIGDLAVISDAVNQEIFIITNIADLVLSHEIFLPWNESNNLDFEYDQGSTISIASSFIFFVEEDEDGHFNLMVENQSIEPQILISDVEDFQIRYKLADDSWVDEFDFIADISLIEVFIRVRSPEEIKNLVDPATGDGYKRIELKTVIRPKYISEES